MVPSGADNMKFKTLKSVLSSNKATVDSMHVFRTDKRKSNSKKIKQQLIPVKPLGQEYLHRASPGRSLWACSWPLLLAFGTELQLWREPQPLPVALPLRGRWHLWSAGNTGQAAAPDPWTPTACSTTQRGWVTLQQRSHMYHWSDYSKAPECSSMLWAEKRAP